MSIYSVSSCMLEKPKEEKCYITGVLHKFSEQGIKVAVDSHGKVIDIYGEKARNNSMIAHWLNIMSMVPSSFEPVCDLPEDEEIDHLDIFVLLASKIPSTPKLIVYSTIILNGKFELDSKHKITFDGKKIKVFDRDKAFKHFNKKKSNKKSSIKNSVIASGGSKIEDVKK